MPYEGLSWEDYPLFASKKNEFGFSCFVVCALDARISFFGVYFQFGFVKLPIFLKA